MTEVLVATITSGLSAAALVVVAIITHGTRKDAKATREQVANSHTTNLREELDERHEQTTEKLDALLSWRDEHTAASMRGASRTTRLELTTGGLVLAAIALAGARLLNRK